MSPVRVQRRAAHQGRRMRAHRWKKKIGETTRFKKYTSAVAASDIRNMADASRNIGNDGKKQGTKVLALDG